jgi:two-component system, NarL family, sensor histidine kinase UhpB
MTGKEGWEEFPISRLSGKGFQRPRITTTEHGSNSSDKIFTVKPSSVSRDVLVILVVTVATFLFAAKVELNEWIVSITRTLEPYQLDELPLTVVVLVLSMGWFSWRRWAQFSKEYELRLAAQQALADTLTENRMLARKYVLAQEEERRILAHELHDELGQSLNAIKLDAVAIRQRAADVSNEVRENAEAIIEVADHVHETVRSLTQRLRPVALDELGLRDALELYIGQWERRNAPVTCIFEARGEFAGLGELVNITLYRYVQECLTNVTRHAAATEVRVNLTQDNENVYLQIEDNGKGMDLAAKRNGLGLVGLRERAESLGGVFELTSDVGVGTRVRLSVPVRRAEH